MSLGVPALVEQICERWFYAKWKLLGRAYLLEAPELTLRQLGGTARLHAVEDK